MPKTKKIKEAEKILLNVKLRNIFGKKLRKLRKEGIIPANIFGTDFKSVSININIKDFLKAYRVARETGVIYISLNNDEIPVLIRNIQKHPVNDNILHVDFRKIDLKKKIVTEVPVKTIGISEAVAQKGGVLLTLTESLLIEALPQDIPQIIAVDISILKEIGQEIKVSDLKTEEKYVIKTDASKVIISVVEHKEESITPETTVAATPEVITEAPAAEEDTTSTETETKAKPEETPAAKSPAK